MSWIFISVWVLFIHLNLPTACKIHLHYSIDNSQSWHFAMVWLILCILVCISIILISFLHLGHWNMILSHQLGNRNRSFNGLPYPLRLLSVEINITFSYHFFKNHDTFWLSLQTFWLQLKEVGKMVPFLPFYRVLHIYLPACPISKVFITFSKEF